ncbi:MAG TPA: hypothetical protein VEG38_00320, partial [Acidimicrobiia bacterium]|nr:hypothetical protein [Acidimicrobiia bacterium]
MTALRGAGAAAKPAASQLLLGGRPVPMAGLPLRIDEATPLAFALGPGVTARLSLAGLPIPLVDGRADPAWVDESRREQWVGELDLELVVTSTPQAIVLRPKIVVLPRRATVEGFAFLVDQFRSWAGPGSLADPAGRARIWAELAPRVPKREEERALVALALLRRAIPALAAIHRAPATTPAERREWRALDRTAGRRLLLKRLHPFDPPRPVHEPRSGQVATIVVEPSTDRAENRFVAGVVRRLVALCREAAESPQWLDPDQVRELTEATRALAALAAEAPWATLPAGAMPRVSFLLRDQPHYRVMRTVADAIDDSLRWSPLPGDPAALGLRTQTLNALFEVWVSQAVRAAARRRLGLAGPLGPPLSRGGAEEAVTPRGRVRVCFDRVYPKPGVTAEEGIVALTRKRSPDATVEWWPTGGQPVVMAVDATWSRNPNYHDDKLGYARSLAAGGSDEMLGTPRLCTRRSLVVYPGPRPEVHELGFALSLATVSAPPSEAGWELLGA